MILQIEQQTEEWFNARLGVITASNFASIMANSIKGKEFNASAPFGNPAREYAMRIALESVTKERIETFSNEYMERGNELEPIARELYEMETFNDVLSGGFAVNNGVGASSDGLVGDRGAIEIKSVIYKTHFKTIESGKYDLKYKWQIQGNIWLYDLDWVDFVSYCPEFPESTRLYVYRVDRDEEMIQRLSERIEEFKGLVSSYKAYLTDKEPVLN